MPGRTMWKLCLIVLCAVPATATLARQPRADAARRGPAQQFSVAELFLELNDTDGDLGIHASIDGGEWTKLEVESPSERTLLVINTSGGMRRQALTQLAFESTEPPFDELAPAVLFRRFPEGVYEISGRAQGGGEYENAVYLSHVLAAAPVAWVSGLPAAESCDDEPLPEVHAPVHIDWDPVTTSHPDLGKPGTIEIARYQFFVEQGSTKLSVDLAPEVTEFEVPVSLTAGGGVFKFEIIARTTTGNNTAIESCFRVPTP